MWPRIRGNDGKIGEDSRGRRVIDRASRADCLVSHRSFMAAYDMAVAPRGFDMERRVITVDPQIQGGVPVFSGTRVPVKNLFDYLEAGDSLDQFLADFPSVERDAAVAVLEQARAAVAPHAHPA